jgi:hypothetical protein
LATRFDAPTLWSATSFVAEEVERVAGGLKILEDDMGPVRSALLEVNQELAKMAKSGQSEKMLKVLVMVSNKVKEASGEIVGLKAKVVSLEAAVSKAATNKQGGKGTKTSLGDGEDDPELDHLMEDFQNSGVSQHEARRGKVTPEKVEREGGGRVERDAQLAMIMGEVTRLTQEVDMLKAGSEDRSVKFAGLGWRSLGDCQEWIKVNFTSNRYGLIMDPLLMLDRALGTSDVAAETQFKTWESRVKLKIATGGDEAAIKAMHFKRPRVFHSGQEAMFTERNKSKLNRLETFKVWKNGGEGVRNHIVKRTNLLMSTIAQDINFVFSKDPKSQMLATMCLNGTMTFITQLLTFVDAIYEKLVMASKFTAEQGWSLTMKILDRICEDLYAPKEGVVDAMNVEDPESICAHLLWACFRTHDVMETYMDANFENHPAVSAEYVKFLALNSGFDKVEKLETMVVALKAQADTATKDAAKARSIADGAASAATATTKAVADLAKRVGNKGNN